MTSNERRYFSGGSLDKAIMQAARHFGIAPEELAYKQIEKKHGFLRARRSVVIEVDPDAPTREPGAEIIATTPTEAGPPPPAETALEAESLDREDEATRPAGEHAETGLDHDHDSDFPPATGELADAARAGLEEILEFAGLTLESKVMQGDGQLEIELWGADRQLLLEDRGNLLLAIQHLMPRMIRGRTGESVPCHVDSENYHETRRVELEAMAREIAREVSEEGRSSSLPPMNPAERRIIHLSLADDPDVETESEGRGFFKRVTVRPAMRRPRGFGPY